MRAPKRCIERVYGKPFTHVPQFSPTWLSAGPPVVVVFQAMLKIPPKSSKWVDMNKDLLKAEDVERLPPPLGVETLTLALDDALAPKNKLAGARVERRPALVATTRRVPGANVKPRA